MRQNRSDKMFGVVYLEMGTTAADFCAAGTVSVTKDFVMSAGITSKKELASNLKRVEDGSPGQTADAVLEDRRCLKIPSEKGFNLWDSIHCVQWQGVEGWMKAFSMSKSALQTGDRTCKLYKTLMLHQRVLLSVIPEI